LVISAQNLGISGKRPRGPHARAGGQARRKRVQGREHLAGIEQTLGVERAFDAAAAWLRSISENIAGHQVALFFHADPRARRSARRQPRRRAAKCPAPNASVRSSSPGLLASYRIRRVQIAVAGVKHIGDAASHSARTIHACAATPAAAWARGIVAIHAVVIGRDAADRRERGLAPGPEQQAFHPPNSRRDTWSNRKSRAKSPRHARSR